MDALKQVPELLVAISAAVDVCEVGSYNRTRYTDEISSLPHTLSRATTGTWIWRLPMQVYVEASFDSN